MLMKDIVPELERRGVDLRYVRVGQVEPDDFDVCCIVKTPPDQWDVFYTEKGMIFDLRTFYVEAAAVTYFLEWTSNLPKITD